MGITPLTKKQKIILDFIKSFQEKNGYPPTLEEIAKKLKLSSVATVHQYLAALERKGYIKKHKGHARSIDISEPEDAVKVPLLGTITAGQPIEAIREKEFINVPKTKIPNPDLGSFYALNVLGDSMVDENINDGDIVLVRHQLLVENGEAAVVYIPEKNEATLKKVYKEKNRFRLQPANPKMRPFYEKNIQIQGKIIGVLRKEN